MNRLYVPSNTFAPNGPCYCRSGEAFGKCCGIKKIDRKPPAGISVIPNFFEPTALKNLVKELRKCPRKPFGVHETPTSKDETAVSTRTSGRITDGIVVNNEIQQVLNSLTGGAIKEKIQPFAKYHITHMEKPYVLYYKKGGRYDSHADSENFDQEKGQFYRAKDRDFSFLIYLNDGYEGGNLKFNFLNYVYRPKAGEAVYFPSGHLFSHQSTPVKRGHKMALVTWVMTREGAKIGTPILPSTHVAL